MQIIYILGQAREDKNIGTLGFFWWYLPKFTSRYHARLRDVENNADIAVERTPELKVSWGNQVLKADDLNHVGAVITFMARSTKEQIQPYHRYFRVLSMLGKNDIFTQFEPQIVIEFVQSFKDAFLAYGDWDGKAETLQDAVQAFFDPRPEAVSFIAMMTDMFQLASDALAGSSPRPTTLEDAIRAKTCFDAYIKVKADRYMRDELAKQNPSSQAS